MKQSEAASPSFLFDLTKLLLADSGLSVNLQVSFGFQVLHFIFFSRHILTVYLIFKLNFVYVVLNPFIFGDDAFF